MKKPVVVAGIVFVAAVALAQSSAPAPSASLAGQTATSADQVIIPAGTKVPVALKAGISSKSAHEGDPVYAVTTFPVVLNDRILIPPGTYVQGRVAHVQRGGHIKGRAQILMHFTTLIFPSGYTVMLPGSIENIPGAEKTNMKGKEGTIEEGGQTGDKVAKAAQAGTGGAMGGAVIGGLSQGSKGAGIGAGIGGAAGAMIALFGRGSDVQLPPGTTVEMVIQRDVPLDPGRARIAVR